MRSYRVSYCGEIAQFPPRELILSLAAQRETGALLLRRERVLKKVFFRRGQLLYAQSNAAREGLLRHLHNRSRLDLAVLSAWVTAHRRDERQSSVFEFLRESGPRSAEEMRATHQQWVRGVLHDAVRWTDGSYVYSFDERPPAAAEEWIEPFDPEAIVIEGLRPGLPPAFLRRHFARRMEETPTLRESAAALAERLGLTGAPGRALQVIEKGGPLRRIVLAAAEVSSEKMFNLCLLLETLGVLQFPQRPAWSAKPLARAPELSVEAMAMASRLKERAPELLKAPPFDLLGVRRVFDEEELRRGYYTLAQAYHQREHVDQLPPELRELSYQIFARASDVFEALVVWEKRRLADNFAAFRALEEETARETALQLESESAFLRANAAAAAGALVEARPLYQAAVDGCPGQSEYRAWLAWTEFQLAAEDAVGKTALSDLRRAAEDDPACVDAKRLYGRALERLGRREQAHAQYAAASELAPQDRELRDAGKRTYSFLSARALSMSEQARVDGVAEEKAMRALLRDMEQGNYFQVLGLPETAGTADIKRRYFELAKQYHPDRFKATRLLDVSERIFVIVNEAYETLSNDRKREQYEAALRALDRQKEQLDRERKLQDERQLQKGKALMQANNWAGACELFEKALAEPGEHAVHHKIYYAWSLFNRDMKRGPAALARAEELLEAAAEEAPNLAEVHVVWGKIHRRMGRTARAKAMFDRALELAPNDVDALRELRLLLQRLGEEEPASAKAEPPADADDKGKKKGVFTSLFGRRKP